MKKIILRGIKVAPIGLLISVVITIIMSLWLGNGAYYPVRPELIEVTGSEINAVILQTIVSLLYGGFFGCMSFIWEKENWSILRQTLTHFLVTIAVTYPIVYFMYWADRSVIGITIYFVIFVFIYFGVWLGLYLNTKFQVDELNKKLNTDK